LKRLVEALRSAHKIELLVIVLFLCILLLLFSGNQGSNPDWQAEGDELRMQRLLSRIQGAGKVSVMLAEDEQEGIIGAVVVSPGADDVRVMLELQRAVQALTKLEIEQIEIVKSER